MTEELLPFCECGECGLRVTKPGNRFITGHNIRGNNNPMKNPDTAKKMSELKTGVPKSPEHCAALSKAKLGKPRTSPAQIAADKAKSENMRGAPRTPEHCTAISAAKLDVPHTTPAQIAADDARRGGNDLVNHHYLYDHADLSLNTVQMTRSDHGKLHRLLQKLAYIVPHINVKGELNE